MSVTFVTHSGSVPTLLSDKNISIGQFCKTLYYTEVNIFQISVFTTSVHVNYEKMVVIVNKLWLKHGCSNTSKTIREGQWL